MWVTYTSCPLLIVMFAVPVGATPSDQVLGSRKLPVCLVENTVPRVVKVTEVGMV